MLLKPNNSGIPGNIRKRSFEMLHFEKEEAAIRVQTGNTYFSEIHTSALKQNEGKTFDLVGKHLNTHRPQSSIM